MDDLLFKNARIVDGSGAPWFRGDVAVRKDRIVRAGGFHNRRAKRVVELEDNFIAPGFIDIHSHSDLLLLIDPRAESKIRQGVTTEVVGHCGWSASPLLGDTLQEVQREWESYSSEGKIGWKTTGEYLARLDQARPALNVAALVGHGILRQGICGHRSSAPTQRQRIAMKRWLHRSLREGAAGLSTGLSYTPSLYASTEELISLARVVAHHGGMYYTHMRRHSENRLTSVDEVLAISRGSGCRCHIAHIHGRVDDVEKIEMGRSEGLDIGFDQYPYIASSSGLSLLLPVWMKEGDREAFMARLKDPSQRQRLEQTESFPSPQAIWVTRVRSQNKKWMEGKALSEIIMKTGQTLVNVVCDLLLEEEGRVGMVHFDQSEEGVRTVMKSPLAIVGSDGSSYAVDGPLRTGLPHPRSFGTFVRMLGHYSRDEGVVSLETAVRQMTSSPAARIGLQGRGILAPGFQADLVAFNKDQIKDTATFLDPFQYPDGILYVVVNGQMVLQGKERTEPRPGRVLKLRRDGKVR